MRRLSLVLILVLMAALSLGMVGCSSADGSGAEVVSGGDSDAESQNGEAEEAEDAVGTRTNPLPLGTTARVGAWEVTVTEVALNANDTVAAANQFNDPPAEGNQYVVISVSATYEGDESGTFWVDMSYKFFGAGGNTFDSGGVTIANSLMDAGETFPGASIAGNMVFEVPSDQVEGGAVIMEESFSLEDTRVFFAIQ